MFKNSVTSKKCPKVTFVDIFIENVDYTFIYYQDIQFVDWNSMKKEVFKKEQVWRINQDKVLIFEGLEH